MITVWPTLGTVASHYRTYHTEEGRWRYTPVALVANTGKCICTRWRHGQRNECRDGSGSKLNHRRFLMSLSSWWMFVLMLFVVALEPSFFNFEGFFLTAQRGIEKVMSSSTIVKLTPRFKCGIRSVLPLLFACFFWWDPHPSAIQFQHRQNNQEKTTAYSTIRQGRSSQKLYIDTKDCWKKTTRNNTNQL